MSTISVEFPGQAQPTRYREPLNRLQITRDLARRQPALTLYMAHYGGWFVTEAYGTHYFIPPDLGGIPIVHVATRKVVPADGCIHLRDTYGEIRTQDGKSKGQGLIHSAIDVAAFLEEQFGSRGLVVLYGRDEAEDAAQKERSKKIAYTFKRKWAEDELASRAKYVENFDKNPANKGRRPPAPTITQREAIEWLDKERERPLDGSYFCAECRLYETPSWEAFQRHMAQSHNMEAVQRPEANAASMSDALPVGRLGPIVPEAPLPDLAAVARALAETPQEQIEHLPVPGIDIPADAEPSGRNRRGARS